MEVAPTEPVGAEVSGVQVARMDDADIDALRGVLAEHGVVVLRGQEVDDGGFVAWLRRFGALTFTTGETPVEGHPDLNVVSNVGRATPPRSSFHVDTSYVRDPPAYTALRAVEVPAAGGETVFTNQYRAAETLPGDLRDAVDGRAITHTVTGVEPGEGEEREARHPALRPHPVTGRVALYLSSPGRCTAVDGLGEADGRELVARLLAHSTQEGNCHRHAWAPGDVVMWDNACVLHKADHAGVEGDRVLHRGMVAHHGADRPGPAA